MNTLKALPEPELARVVRLAETAIMSVPGVLGVAFRPKVDTNVVRIEFVGVADLEEVVDAIGHIIPRDVAYGTVTRVTPIPTRLVCPSCGMLHLDEGVHRHRPHRTHLCNDPRCAAEWHPYDYPNYGVAWGAI